MVRALEALGVLVGMGRVQLWQHCESWTEQVGCTVNHMASLVHLRLESKARRGSLYLEGSGDLVKRFIVGIIEANYGLKGSMYTYLLSPLDPSSHADMKCRHNFGTDLTHRSLNIEHSSLGFRGSRVWVCSAQKPKAIVSVPCLSTIFEQTTFSTRHGEETTFAWAKEAMDKASTT